MTPPRIIGIVLLVCGVVLLVMGLQASNSFADQVSNTFTGHFTHDTTWYILGGIVSGIAGLCLLFFGVSGKTS
jgi:Protein of unknown function (DUF3185)